MPATTTNGRFLAETHEVVNVARELQDFNLYRSDPALREAIGELFASRGVHAAPDEVMVTSGATDRCLRRYSTT